MLYNINKGIYKLNTWVILLFQCTSLSCVWEWSRTFQAQDLTTSHCREMERANQIVSKINKVTNNICRMQFKAIYTRLLTILKFNKREKQIPTTKRNQNFPNNINNGLVLTRCMLYRQFSSVLQCGMLQMFPCTDWKVLQRNHCVHILKQMHWFNVFVLYLCTIKPL